jgi:hypothetical protein
MTIGAAVISKTWTHDIGLEPDQVDVERLGTAQAPVVFLAADDKVTNRPAGYAFPLHFKPDAGGRVARAAVV